MRRGITATALAATPALAATAALAAIARGGGDGESPKGGSVALKPKDDTDFPARAAAPTGHEGETYAVPQIGVIDSMGVFDNNAGVFCGNADVFYDNPGVFYDKRIRKDAGAVRG